MFRRGRAAERAEADGRVDEAIRLYLDAGERDEAVRVLLRAADTARTLDTRRALLVRAYGLVKDPALRDEARRGVALCTLAELEESPPRTDEERRRLAEAARELEALGAFREAARGFDLLDDREAVVRVLTLAGDVEGMEKLVGDRDDEERRDMRRHAAMDTFEGLWTSGDRVRALEELRTWLASNPDDHEARAAHDDRAARLLRGAVTDLLVDGKRVTVVSRLPVTLGREGDVVVRGASVSRLHARVAWRDGEFLLEDAGSRAGTTLDGLPIASALPLREGAAVGLGTDLSLRAACTETTLTLEVERGMERGRAVVLTRDAWATPMGALRFGDDGPTLTPDAGVRLNGQRVAVPVVLVRGDRVERGASTLRVLERGK
ncbi:MAG: FHA domain-containing protein [Polyangiales bacterium]